MMEQVTQSQTTSCRNSISVEDLSRGGQLFIWSMREWARAAIMKECVCEELYQAYAGAGCAAAVSLLDEFMTLLALAAKRPVDARCPCSSELSDDEALILKLLTLLQKKQNAESIKLIQNLLQGSIASAFSRAASLYAENLANSNLMLATPPKLRLVSNSRLSA